MTHLKLTVLVGTLIAILMAPGIATSSPKLYWSNGNEILESNVSGSGAHSFVTLPEGRHPTSTYFINFLAANKHYVFWMNDRGGVGRLTRSGHRAHLISGNHNRDGGFSSGLTVHGHRVFWVRSYDEHDVLYSTSTSGHGKHKFVTNNGEKLGNLIGVRGKQLIWASPLDPTSDRRSRIGVFATKTDGQARHRIGLLPTNQREIYAYSVIGKRIYWIWHRAIYKADIAGKHPKLVTRTGRYMPFTMTAGADRVFWAAQLWGRDTIRNEIGTFRANGTHRKTAQRIVGQPGTPGVTSMAVSR